MNSKTKTFSMFLLAAILVAGTISMTIPQSFALQFGDSFANDYKKHGSNVNIQKVKCNNIIINGVEKSPQRMPTGDMPDNTMAAADENDVTGQIIRDGSASGENKFKSISGNIVNVCINKNNIVAAAEEDLDECQECIEQSLTPIEIINVNNFLIRSDGFTFQVGTDTAQQVNSLDDVCDIINGAGGQVTGANIQAFFEVINEELPPEQQISETTILELINCLANVGLLIPS